MVKPCKRNITKRCGRTSVKQYIQNLKKLAKLKTWKGGLSNREHLGELKIRKAVQEKN